MEADVTPTCAEKVQSTSSPGTKDSGKIRIGTLSPTFPPARAKPDNVADSGRLRMGTLSPTFPRTR
jgi:hypothetical protein